MAKKKKDETRIEEDVLEGADEIVPEEEPELEALEEETGEAAVTEEEAAEAVEGEAGVQKLTLTFIEAPQLEGLNPGDEVDLITTFKVIRKGDTDVDVEAIDFMPVEEMEAPEEAGVEPVPMPPAGAPPAPGGGGLAGIV